MIGAVCECESFQDAADSVGVSADIAFVPLADVASLECHRDVRLVASVSVRNRLHLLRRPGSSTAFPVAVAGEPTFCSSLAEGLPRVDARSMAAAAGRASCDDVLALGNELAADLFGLQIIERDVAQTRHSHAAYAVLAVSPIFETADASWIATSARDEVVLRRVMVTLAGENVTRVEASAGRRGHIIIVEIRAQAVAAASTRLISSLNRCGAETKLLGIGTCLACPFENGPDRLFGDDTLRDVAAVWSAPDKEEVADVA